MKNKGLAISLVLIAASSVSAQEWKSGSEMLINQANVGALETEVRLLKLQVDRAKLLKEKRAAEQLSGEGEARNSQPSFAEQNQPPARSVEFPFEGYTVAETYSAPEADGFSASIRGPDGEVVVETGKTYSGWVAIEVTLGGVKFVHPGTDMSRILGLAGS